MAARKKIRAKVLATTAWTPAALSPSAGCSRLEPHPKFLPARITSPGLDLLRELRVQVLEQVRQDLLRLAARVGVPPREQQVGVDVVAVLEDVHRDLTLFTAELMDQ